ncbi:MAG: phosphoribosyltransferase [Gammaproteobacteria bacterium]|nr:phosphoribosyltransferase [Gammaproteobacteria bacterium]
MKKYRNRAQAGQVLAEILRASSLSVDAVLALPRGGVPVASVIAKTLNAPLDVFIVRKLGVPGHEELAMGAIASPDVCVFNESIIRDLNIDQADINEEISNERKELKRREHLYRHNKTPLVLANKVVVLVDDGIATGASMRAAILALKQLSPKQIILAVPVADAEMIHSFAPLVDQVICPLQPDSLVAVGAWYDDFTQTEDSEVQALLE